MTAAPRLLGLKTAVPGHRLRQADVMARARQLFAGRPAEEIERLLPVYANAGIETRHSCVPLEWYERPHGWAEKNALFLEHAVALGEQAMRGCLAAAGLGIADVDVVVTVSTSGIATPSLDARLVESLGMRRDVERLPIFGLGCAGGVLGLARAASMARARPGATVLFLVVELCGLTFRRDDHSNSNVIASALFADGAAAAVIRCADAGPALSAWGEHTWPDSLDVMGWRVEDDGLGVQFSRNIPSIIRGGFRAVVDNFLDRGGMTIEGIEHFLCHPGGTKVVDALEDALSLPRGGLTHSRGILREYGNMSAATALFVLERALTAGARGRMLLSAVGPGFSAGFMILDTP